MADRKVAIRLGTEGKANVVRDFRDLGDAGEAEAKRWAKAFDNASSQVDSAIQRQAQAAAKLAAITPQTATQQIYQAGASTNYTGLSARDSAAAIKEQLDLQDQLQARAIALKEKLDPLYVAQKKFDDELKNAGELKAAGAISDELYEKAIIESTAALNQAKRAVDGHSNSLGLNRTQFLIAQGAAHRYIDSILAGMSPTRAFMMQAGDLGNILAMDNGGVAGGLAKVRALFNPVTVGITATTAAVVIGAAAWYSYSQSVNKLTSLAQGSGAVLGLSGDQLRANAELAANAAHITTSAASEIQAAYLGVAKSGDVLANMTVITRDFAAATGQDLKAASANLATIFSDPIAGAEQLAEKYGLVSQAQADHIAKLVEEGRQADAQRALYATIQDGLAGAADRAQGFAGALDRIAASASGAYNWLGKMLDRASNNGAIAGLLMGMPGGQSLGQYFLPTNSNVVTSDARTRQQNAARAAAAGALGSYQGDNRDSYRRTVGVLNAGIAAGGDPAQIKDLTAARDAYTRALNTWIPAQQKANELADVDAKIAKAKTPAEKSALAAEKARIQAKGEVVTASDLEARAQDKATAAGARATKGNGAHAASLARQAESMEVAARSSLDLADAYLKSSAAGVEAEARRKAATDATRKGIDVDAQARRQLNLSVAETIATSAKSIAQMKDETVARMAVNDNVAAGKLSIADMNDALSDEAALRPLLTLRTIAQGDALAALNKVIDAYRAALKAAHDEEGRSKALDATKSAKRQIDEITASLNDFDLSNRDQMLNAARRAAEQWANDNNLTDEPGKNTRSDYIESQVRAALAQYQKDVATAYRDQKQSLTDNLTLTQAEIGLIGKSADQHDLVISRLQREQQLKQTFGTLDSDAVRTLLAQGDALDAANLKLRHMNDNWQEIRGYGEGFLDSVLNVQNWDNWGDAGKRILQDLGNEFLKLAAINPLKNLLFGDNLPTLGNVLGALTGSVSHGASTGTAVHANAAGTEYFGGGATWVGEHGAELVNLPRGSKISTAAQSARIAASANDNRSAPIVNVYANDAVLAETVRGWVAQGIEVASVRGTFGGAQMAKRDRYREVSRALPA